MTTAVDFALLEFVPDAIVVVRADGSIVYLNTSAEKMFGYARNEVVGQAVEVLVPPHARAAHRQHRNTYAAAPRVRPMGIGLDLEGRRKDGQQFTAEINLAPMQHEGESFVITTVRDVTERRQLEARARLQQQTEEKLRDREDALSVASHELRTPVGALQLNLRLLEKAFEESRDQATVAGLFIRAKNVSDRIALLVNQLMDLTRLRRGLLELTIEEFDLAASVTQIVSDLRLQLERSGSEIRLHTESVTGHWDRLRIEVVVTNLLVNAAKHGEGKPISVRVGGTAERAWVTVRDRGIGIAEEDQERIFGQFERAGPTQGSGTGGLGLGLFISRKIVEAHGGQIVLHSARGSGATFTVELPRVPPLRSGPAQAA